MKRYIKNTLKLFLGRVSENHTSAYAAQASYFIMMSVMPFCILLISMIMQSPLDYSSLWETLSELAPGFIKSILSEVLTEAFHRKLTYVASFSILFILWASGRGMMSIRSGLNTIYKQKETRNYLYVRLISTFYAIILAAAMVTMLGFLVFGRTIFNKIASYIPALKSIFIVSLAMRILVLYALLSLIFLMMYRFMPTLHMRFLYVLPGALSCAGAWVVTSIIFSIYFRLSSGMSSTYGSLAAIMVLMLWLYVCMFELLLCGELNYMLHPNGQNVRHSVFVSHEFRHTDL